MEELFTIPEVARYLKMSKSKIYALVTQGKIAHIKVGRNVRIRKADLEEFLSEHVRQVNLGVYRVSDKREF